MSARRLLAFVAGLLALAPAARAQAPANAPGPADTVQTLSGVRTGFNIIGRESYLRRHAYSLDHFLEFEPGGMLVRLGPIGNDAFYSRLGLGRGRALVTVNGIPVNDPQDGRAPLVHIATSGLYTLTLDAPLHESMMSSIEGTLAMHEMEALPSRPHTFIELSKGSNDLRQRRVRFGSQKGAVGIDLTYDEVLDDGYNFDADDVVPDPPVFGEANTRNAAVVVRGDLDDGTGYSVGLRRFRATSEGDLQSSQNESARSGHIAWAGLHTGPVRGTVYGRGYSSDRPDSSTTNETVGGLLAWDARRRDGALHVFALAEHTNASQTLAGADALTRVNMASAGASTEAKRGGLTVFADGSVAGDQKSWAWSAGAGARHALGRGDVTVTGRRMFRLPSIGERYAPEHVRNGLLLSGNQGLDAETALEARGEWTLRIGAVTNRLGASWMRSDDYIAHRHSDGDSLSRLALNADDQPAMTFIEERLGVAALLGALEVRGDVGGYFSTGDRSGMFRSVPRSQLNAALELGRQFFEKSSALYVGAEYAFVDEREDYRGAVLPAFQVVNVSLVGRLVDARVYVRWLNVLDESYETVSGYLMTPNTIAYGIEWTLFD